MTDLELNRGYRLAVRLVGNEQTPVLIIDEPIQSTEALVDHAATRAEFSTKDTQAYPGVRAGLPRAYARTLVPELRKLIAETYRPPDAFELRVVHELYSLVSRRPEELEMLQRVPHFDHHSPLYFATVHYLTPGPHGGTGIFRHRPTGFESVSEERRPLFVRAARAHLESHGPPDARYINASDEHFERIAELEYRRNRLVLYPGYLLHSGLIRPDRDISTDPRSGRLTANLFLLFSDPHHEPPPGS